MLFSHRIPTSTSSKLSLGALRRGDTSSDFSLNRDDLLTACSLLCTADYCLETTQQLEAKLKEKIDQNFKEKIDFSQEEEHFRRCVGVVLISAWYVALTLLLCPIASSRVVSSSWFRTRRMLAYLHSLLWLRYCALKRHDYGTV